MKDFIAVQQGNQVVPIVPRVVRKSSGLAARGVHVEHHVVEPTEFPERELLQHNIFLYTGPAAQAEIKSREFTGKRWIRPGTLWVMPRGSRHGVRFESRMEGVALAFDPARFDDMVESAGGRSSLSIVESLTACPPKIDHLMRALMHESNDPSTEDDLGLECIATAIALSLCQQAGVAPGAAKTGARLAPKQMRAVQAYVAGHLEKAISLAQMAEVAGLSTFHFLRGFKGSLGVTPARYVLDRRMERARWLLESSNLTVFEVGVSVGFEQVSHFSRAFRRTMGVSPTAFRSAAEA